MKIDMDDDNVTDANGEILRAGDRVYALDVWSDHPVYGILLKGEEGWHVAYEDGEDCLVLDFNQLWKA